MRALGWTLRGFVFLVLFGFAVKNTETVSLRFFFDTTWQVPLVVLLFGFFAGGALLALLSVSGGLLKSRLDAARRQKEAAPESRAPRSP